MSQPNVGWQNRISTLWHDTEREAFIEDIDGALSAGWTPPKWWQFWRWSESYWKWSKNNRRFAKARYGVYKRVVKRYT